MPNRGSRIASLRHFGHRLGLVRRVRPRKTNPQSWHLAGSMRNRPCRDPPTDLTMCARCSSTCRSGMP